MRAATDSGTGSLRLAQPLPGWIIAALTLPITLSTALFAIYGSVTRKTNLSGVVVPVDGNAMIASTTAGVLKHVFVSDGQPPFEITNERRTGDGGIGNMLACELDTRRMSPDTDKRLKHHQHQEKLNDLKRLVQPRLAKRSIVSK